MRKTSKAFTLLEIVIVIIIIGVLASLALPKLFGMVESSRSAEALASFATLRREIERCYLMYGPGGSGLPAYGYYPAICFL